MSEMYIPQLSDEVVVVHQFKTKVELMHAVEHPEVMRKLIENYPVELYAFGVDMEAKQVKARKIENPNITYH